MRQLWRPRRLNARGMLGTCLLVPPTASVEDKFLSQGLRRHLLETPATQSMDHGPAAPAPGAGGTCRPQPSQCRPHWDAGSSKASRRVTRTPKFEQHERAFRDLAGAGGRHRQKASRTPETAGPASGGTGCRHVTVWVLPASGLVNADACVNRPCLGGPYVTSFRITSAQTHRALSGHRTGPGPRGPGGASVNQPRRVPSSSRSPSLPATPPPCHTAGAAS